MDYPGGGVDRGIMHAGEHPDPCGNGCPRDSDNIAEPRAICHFRSHPGGGGLGRAPDRKLNDLAGW